MSRGQVDPGPDDGIDGAFEARHLDGGQLGVLGRLQVGPQAGQPNARCPGDPSRGLDRVVAGEPAAPQPGLDLQLEVERRVRATAAAAAAAPTRVSPRSAESLALTPIRWRAASAAHDAGTG